MEGLTVALAKGIPPVHLQSDATMDEHAKPPFPKQKQSMPGKTNPMEPVPDHGEKSYRVKDAGRKAVLVAGDIQQPNHCRAIVKRALAELGAIDILVNNAAHQATFASIEDISDEEWELTFKVNIHAMFYLTKAAVPHMRPGSAIINTASINSDIPNPTLLAYATTKGAIQNFTAGLAQLLAEKEIRANAVAPGPIWTPLIPSTMPQDAVANFGKQVPMKRPGQPEEVAPAFVFFASDQDSSYITGEVLTLLGGETTAG